MSEDDKSYRLNKLRYFRSLNLDSAINQMLEDEKLEKISKEYKSKTLAIPINRSTELNRDEYDYNTMLDDLYKYKKKMEKKSKMYGI